MNCHNQVNYVFCLRIKEFENSIEAFEIRHKNVASQFQNYGFRVGDMKQHNLSE